MFNIISSALSGLQAYQKQLQVISNNLSNTETTAYKTQRVTLYEAGGWGLNNFFSSGAAAGIYGLGVQSGLVTTIPTQGEISSTDVSTDMAVNGEGYFILLGNGKQFFTRDGAFQLDGEGNLVSAQGYSVMGYPAEEGVITTGSGISPLSIPLQQLTKARPTSILSLNGNLDSSGDIYIPSNGDDSESGEVARLNAQVHDSLGNSHTLNITLKYLGNSNWSWEITLPEEETSTLENATGTISFDTSGNAKTPYPTFKINPSGGAMQEQKIELNLDDLKFLADDTSVEAQDTDGYARGTLNSFGIDENGIITGTFSTGMTEILGQLALALFNNPAGLIDKGDNLWLDSSNSGKPVITQPGANGAGEIKSMSLEGSNVDLNAQLIQTMTAQRAYQANSKVIGVADQLLETIINLRS